MSMRVNFVFLKIKIFTNTFKIWYMLSIIFISYFILLFSLFFLESKCLNCFLWLSFFLLILFLTFSFSFSSGSGGWLHSKQKKNITRTYKPTYTYTIPGEGEKNEKKTHTKSNFSWILLSNFQLNFKDLISASKPS